MMHAFDQVAADSSSGEKGLQTVVQVLQEGKYHLHTPGYVNLSISDAPGPDYLIDIGLIECVAWQAEVIDPIYGANIRNLLDEAVKAQVDLSE